MRPAYHEHKSLPHINERSSCTGAMQDAMLPTPGASVDRLRRPFTQLAHSPTGSPVYDWFKHLQPHSSLDHTAMQLSSVNPRGSGSPCTPPCSSDPVTTPSPTTSRAAAAVEGATSLAPSTLLARGAQSFAQAVLESRLVMSALLQLEQSSGHPPVHEATGAHSLHYTLAQMLALHLRAQFDTASEVQLLTLLWTLEAWGSSARARCTDTLYSYLQNLDCFDSQRAQHMGQNWAQEFLGLRRAMVQCQGELLARLNWAVRLDFITEVVPCMHLLFPALPRTALPSTGLRPWPMLASAPVATHSSQLALVLPATEVTAAAAPAAGTVTWQPCALECRLLRLCCTIQQYAAAARPPVVQRITT